MCAVLLLALPLDLYAQRGRKSEVDFWIGVPLSLSGRVSTAQLNANQPLDNIRDAELNVLTQVMFEIGDIVSIGPEVGLFYPPGSVADAIQANNGDRLVDIIRLPINAVLDIAVSKSGLFHIQFLTGMRFNFWDEAEVRGLKTLTFDLGARIEIAGVFFETTYSIPYSVDLDRSTSSSVSADTLGRWDDSLNLAIGYLFRI